MNENIIKDTKSKMIKCLDNLEHRFNTVRAGRANPSSLDGVYVSYYGTDTPLKQMATISVPEARQLFIKPFDKSVLGDIERSILASNLGYTPSNNGESIIITIPVLTEERRRELIKQVKALSEECKVAIRNVRQDSKKDIEKLEVSDDEVKRLETELQNIVNEYNKLVDKKLDEKTDELMTV